MEGGDSCLSWKAGLMGVEVGGNFGDLPAEERRLMPLGVIGNTLASGARESWFDPRRGNAGTLMTPCHQSEVSSEVSGAFQPRIIERLCPDSRTGAFGVYVVQGT